MFALLLLASFATADAYIWPSPQLDALVEALRFDLDKNSIAPFIKPCNTFAFDPNKVFGGPSDTGRSDVADWIRTAYHDMATYNITDGTGGLDASIRLAEEQARPENAGDGFNNTAAAFIPIANRYVSIADALVIGTIIAIENCGGPEIAFHGGRVDAGEANAPGVPQPQDDISTHIADFARQGFSQTEMVGLVACGHTFGGVQHVPFPDIVPVLNDTTNTESVGHFDTTPVTFDNNVATQYISGTTLNPLVVGLNETKNSDKHIFGSDRNATMTAFANSANLFASTCAGLFARMFDTVPKGVQLIDVFTPLPVKPCNVQLVLNGDSLVQQASVWLRETNSLELSGELRLWDPPANATHAVSLLWDDRLQGTNNVTLRYETLRTSAGGRHTAAWYAFGPTPAIGFETIDPAVGINNMRFVSGVGFVVHDDIVFAKTSCHNSRTTTGRFDVAVRNGVNPTRLYLEEQTRDSTSRPVLVQVDVPPPSQPAQPTRNQTYYTIWSVNITNALNQYTIAAEVGGVTIQRNVPVSPFSFAAC